MHARRDVGMVVRWPRWAGAAFTVGTREGRIIKTGLAAMSLSKVGTRTGELDFVRAQSTASVARPRAAAPIRPDVLKYSESETEIAKTLDTGEPSRAAQPAVDRDKPGKANPMPDRAQNRAAVIGFDTGEAVRGARVAAPAKAGRVSAWAQAAAETPVGAPSRRAAAHLSEISDGVSRNRSPAILGGAAVAAKATDACTHNSLAGTTKHALSAGSVVGVSIRGGGAFQPIHGHASPKGYPAISAPNASRTGGGRTLPVGARGSALSRFAPAAVRQPPEIAGTQAEPAFSSASTGAALAKMSAAPGGQSGADTTGGPAASGGGPTEGDLYLDGTLMGRWMTRTLTASAARPPVGGAVFDPTRGRLPIGAMIGA